MVLLRSLKNIISIPELTRKILFTLGVIIVFRLGSNIPVMGVNVELLTELMKRSSTLGGLLKYLDIFSGGSLDKSTIFALGISPYITASIMMQMLSMTVPTFEALAKEGEYGRKIINQYTRYLTLGLSIMYSFAYAFFIENQGLALTPGWGFRIPFVLTLTVGSLFVMWLGEQISLFGLGNGSSVLIFAGIISRFPDNFIRIWTAVFDTHSLPGWQAIVILLIMIIVIALIIYVEKGERKIPVQYARRVVGQRVYGGQSTYIPFKINTSGVMPVIFAGAMLNIPLVISTLLSYKFDFFKRVATEWFDRGGVLFNTTEFLLIIGFSFFYTALIFNPDELADNIKKSGGFIPGIRPGKRTAEFFNYILTRVGLVGAIYLACLAIAPNIVSAVMRLPSKLSGGGASALIGGTSLLIVVGVALEVASQIESYLIEHRYEGFLSSGRIKNPRRMM